MRTVGIIAEYNPFHSGHEYHLKKAKEDGKADFAVVIMSPDFVQRGEPAIFDKYTRAHMALLTGADLILELPVCYACGSAEYFAEGAVRMLDGLNVVDSLCFGAENTDTDLFLQTASVLAEEPVKYKLSLHDSLCKGLTFPEARAAALMQYLGDSDTVSLFLSSPNNILGIEYCKALQKFHSKIIPQPLAREGSGYLEQEIKGTYCSANAIRGVIKNIYAKHGCTADKSDESSAQSTENFAQIFEKYIPQACQDLFSAACKTPVFADDLNSVLTQKLIYRDDFDDILDISGELSKRIRKLRFKCAGKSFNEITDILKTRQVAESRIRRALLHLILDIRKKDTEEARDSGTVFYAHVLGFRKDALPLLHEIKKRGTLPLLTRASRAPGMLSGKGLKMWNQDTAASHLYRSIQTAAYDIPFKSEYEISPLII